MCVLSITFAKSVTMNVNISKNDEPSSEVAVTSSCHVTSLRIS